MIIQAAHGAGGRTTADLIDRVFAARFANPVLARMEDAAVVEGSARIAVTTDSFVVTPLFFPGGSIGKLAVCGTVNDLSMSGAVPRYLTCGFIMEEGLPVDTLERAVIDMAAAAAQAGVQIIAGDTKVIEGNGGLYINTTGVGFVPDDRVIPGPGGIMPGDAILLSGNLGDHHAAILSARMGITNDIKSDAALLMPLSDALFAGGIRIRAMRDVTRGGLATVLEEFARASSVGMDIAEDALPVDPRVRAFCGILGLDPLYMANEGKMMAVVDPMQEEKALEIMRREIGGENAAIIGHATAPDDPRFPRVTLKTHIGGRRVLRALSGEGLPRIC